MADEVCPIAGTVLNLLTGQPVDRVTLRLVGVQNSYSATTDVRGGFTLPRVAPGRYRMDATRTGFGTTVTVPAIRRGAAGVLLLDPPCAGLKDLPFRIAPNAVLTGRVLDSDGLPVVGARLSVIEPRDFRGTKSLMHVDSTSTNKLGDFQFVGLSPGRYFLVAVQHRAVLQFALF